MTSRLRDSEDILDYCEIIREMVKITKIIEDIQDEGIQMRIVMVMQRTIKYLLGIIRGRIRIIMVMIKKIVVAINGYDKVKRVMIRTIREFLKIIRDTHCNKGLVRIQ
jgi:hypothetical protein